MSTSSAWHGCTSPNIILLTCLCVLIGADHAPCPATTPACEMGNRDWYRKIEYLCRLIPRGASRSPGEVLKRASSCRRFTSRACQVSACDVRHDHQVSEVEPARAEAAEVCPNGLSTGSSAGACVICYQHGCGWTQVASSYAAKPVSGSSSTTSWVTEVGFRAPH